MGVLSDVQHCTQNRTNSRRKTFPPREKYGFFTVFELPISQRVFVEWKGPGYEKYSKFFELFENFWKKGLAHPQRTQTCKWNFQKSRKNMAFSLILTFQYINEFLSSDKGQGMKNILNFSNFSKMFETRA